MCLDANKNVDYLATLSSGNSSSSRSPAAGGAGRPSRGLFPLGRERQGGGGPPSSGGSGMLGVGRGGFPPNILRAADAVSGATLQRKRKRQQEIDERERDQVRGACVFLFPCLGRRVCTFEATCFRFACVWFQFQCSISGSDSISGGGGGSSKQTGRSDG